MIKILTLFKEFYNSKGLILKLAKNDFWAKYASSQLGILWAFVQPLMTIIVYWFIFEIGFRVVPLNNIPYILWLMCGLIPWFFFSEALGNSTNSLIEYSYLVKKVVFKVSILPSIKIISALFVHVFFMAFLLYVYFLHGYEPTIYMLQLFYYLFALCFLLLGLSYITASCVIFFRDLNQIVAIILQFGIWLSPILWQPSLFPAKYLTLLKLNPMYYIVEGYRDSLVSEVWFWQKPEMTLYFWCVSFIVFLVGALFYKKLKPHFADVL
ncbi:ABC transporter permease [Paenibacillus sp. EKM102P]|uniref:ABC transporter permease n=1 Tax=unclassified Paenibacillus TaxID=185978 RepID=UPI00142E5B1D|nr:MULTISPECIES: ABC transporter permease [unclassified Paenibacillus]KAF6621083.1 ABC transporter permease [Paenibacillus sp. EKM101P]KAF6622387.1 ABC transporter permease [Paenibacillus sp. EKM102P]KAF6632235.1 ABC transporter permease [Paenibacillus sp. EKM10P]KAF6646991.1 ABC transporter permease [Paenibacillus sp. EKM11P]